MSNVDVLNGVVGGFSHKHNRQAQKKKKKETKTYLSEIVDCMEKRRVNKRSGVSMRDGFAVIFLP